MTVPPIIAIGLGAALGAWCRWGLALALNALNPRLPFGTLAANLVGGVAIGAFVGFAARSPELEAWRPFIVTGLLGALTTFSTFSAESLALLQRAALGGGRRHAGMHLFGTLLAAAAGFHFAYR